MGDWFSLFISLCAFILGNWFFLSIPQLACIMCDWFTKSRTKGGFTQVVDIHSSVDGNVIKRITVEIDPGNQGPNLITYDVMRDVDGQPAGPGMSIETVDGVITDTGGAVQLTFSGLSKNKRYTETFHHLPSITDGVDMVLNRDFYVKEFPKQIPPMLMIRAVTGKSEAKKQETKADEQNQEKSAEQQEAERQVESEAAEEERKAKEAQHGDWSNHSSGGNNGSSGY